MDAIAFMTLVSLRRLSKVYLVVDRAGCVFGRTMYLERAISIASERFDRWPQPYGVVRLPMVTQVIMETNSDGVVDEIYGWPNRGWKIVASIGR